MEGWNVLQLMEIRGKKKDLESCTSRSRNSATIKMELFATIGNGRAYKQ